MIELKELYNNRVLTKEDRVECVKEIDKVIKGYRISIEGMTFVRNNFPQSENKAVRDMNEVFYKTSIFFCYTFCDCAVLTKYFIATYDKYEKSFFRGKLQVVLNEGFKRLYGFSIKNRKNTIWYRFVKIADIFPSYKNEIESITHDLDELSNTQTWWKDERNIEVHQDYENIYESRHVPIVENRVIVESMMLLDMLSKINDLICRINRSFIEWAKDYIIEYK